MTLAAAILFVTIQFAARNEAANLPKCLAAIRPAERVIAADSRSTDRTAEIAAVAGAEGGQFDHWGGYPKKRQCELETVSLGTDWVLLLDADAVVPPPL